MQEDIIEKNLLRVFFREGDILGTSVKFRVHNIFLLLCRDTPRSS
jgi:hypothetical protein